MVNYCVCGGCTNSSLSGHRVHRFPNKKKDGAIFRAWVRFVQTKRRDFSSASASKNAVVCSVHFRPEDYRPGDIMEVNMGCRSKNQVRLQADAVPSVHATTGSAGGRRYYGHRSARNASLRQRKVCRDLEDIESNEVGDQSTASAAVLADPEQEAFSPLAPQSSVLHFGPQCNLRSSHRSSVFPQPTTPGTGKQSKKRKTVLQTATTKKRLDQQRAQTRVNIGVAFPRWRQLRDSKGLKTDAMLAVFLLDSYEKTAASTALVHELPKPPPPPPVSTNISDRKGQEMKSECFGPWSSVLLKLEQVQEDCDGNDLSSFSVDIIQVKQEDPVQVKQEGSIHVKQEDPVQVKQEDSIQVKQEDTGESEFWCSSSMQQDPEMSGGADASHPVSLHFNKLKEMDHYCGNGESLPSEDLVQALKSEDLKTEEPIEEQAWTGRIT
ncbi:uncharacterized protein LOC125243875 [Megalobrama amblycephala]|uniref:uncharacterized protein LOC125243875 n=1 Tax=Megalobrama amblycephala TaxID=75352 RepID=UPI002014827E|nr:uncharacterized protein LOC125243875 [Megalobrama amblycephala]XP_048009676.1 uncharacterized protein LOC125243875 [Megalobrama amblycephala]XP_048009677.1 uncharacterized protein LOC125243875 [Megalobrama amblycephala]